MSNAATYALQVAQSGYGPCDEQLLPHGHAEIIASKKRKRNEAEIADPAGWAAFEIEKHPQIAASATDSSTHFSPQLLLPRSCLPLAYVDAASHAQLPPRSRLFTAGNETLRALERALSCEPVVLIAENMHSKSLFAVEQVDKNLFALCALAAWVTLQMLKRKVGAQQPKAMNQRAKPGPIHGQSVQPLSADCWWKTASVPTEKWQSPVEHVANVTHPSTASDDVLGSSGNDYPPLLVEEAKSQSMISVEQPLFDAFQDPRSTLDTISDQYQVALYISKAPLAYFVKGPLSRARACFQRNDGGSPDFSDLVAHLRSLILPLSTIDKKYRETVPGLVKELPFNVVSEDDGASVLASWTKAQRSKKVKLGKDGLYPSEKTSIAQWWLSKDVSNLSADTPELREAITRDLLLEQRSRETQLQIILVLETLAIEKSAPDSGLPAVIGGNWSAVTDESRAKAKKPKKPQDLGMLLGLMVDRLSIWQSMAIEEESAQDEERSESQGTDQHIEKGKPSAKVNYLHQFCVDVVIPFYGARLPEKSTLLCQKLGVPKDPSSSRPALSKVASVHVTSSKPGAAISRQMLCKPRKTLERVLTDDRPSHRRQRPSLSRSATESSLPQLKREVSETSLSSIPLNRVVMSKRYSQREVDLRAASQATEAKMKKRANIEQELQGAIAALKRPNPRMAVKELIEYAEKRADVPRSRKPKNPVRNPFAQGMQVMATPGKDRRRGSFPGLPRLPRETETAIVEVEEIPPSSISKVACSTTKSFASSRLPRASTKVSVERGFDVEQTPTRGPSKFFGRPASPSGAQSTISFACASSLEATVSAASRHQVLPPRPAPTLMAVNATPNRLRRSGGANALGMNAAPLKVQVCDANGHSTSQESTLSSEPTTERPNDDEGGDVDDVQLL